MKRCSQCDVPNGLPELFCGACGQVLEESTYLRAIAICSAMSVATHGVLRLVGVYTRFSIPDLFVLATWFLLVLYPTYKLRQGQREPERKVALEMLSVHGDRWSRVMLLSLPVLGAWFFLKPSGAQPPTGEPLIANELIRTLRNGLFLGIGAFGYFVALIIVWTQGWAFFDPRVEHTYRGRF
jgi:hypothetical protein